MSKNNSSIKKMFERGLAGTHRTEEMTGIEGRTVFSKVSYEILEKLVNAGSERFNTFNKDIAYQMMVNDQYLSRVSEKNDTVDLKHKFSDFITRNKDYVIKKQQRSDERKLKVTKEIEATIFQVPGNKEVKEVRKPKEYYDDMKKFTQSVSTKIEELKKKNEEKEKEDCKGRPTINKVSKKSLSCRNRKRLQRKKTIA